MIDKPDLVAQLYRTDWTRLRLSATISWRRDRLVYQQLQRRMLMGHRELLGFSGPPSHWPPDDEPESATRWATKQRVLVAPGGRYRVMTGDQLTAVCDGESRWEIDSYNDSDTDTAERSPAGRTPGSEFSGLLTPQWLIAYYDLEIRAETTVGGRSVIGVAATPRSLNLQVGTDRYRLLDRIDVLIDAEFGFIVRSEQIFAGQTVEVAELTDLVIDPPQIYNPPLAADPRLFQPPPGMPSQADLDDAAEPEYEAAADRGPDGLGWQAATTAAGLAASAMGFAVRHAPRHAPRRDPDDAEATMPTDAVLTDAVLDDRLSDSLSVELINLLHRTGLPPQEFAAELHRWADGQPMVDGIRAIRAASTLLNGLLGPDALWQAISERESGDTTHWSGRLRVAMPGRYRLDYLTGNWERRHRSVACDGEQTTTGYDNRVVTGPARQVEPAIGTLIDPAWLLDGWQLSAAGEVTAPDLVLRITAGDPYRAAAGHSRRQDQHRRGTRPGGVPDRARARHANRCQLRRPLRPPGPASASEQSGQRGDSRRGRRRARCRRSHRLA